ncbi:hypothetical protein DLAC_10956 [Tieghemostelium lacteum]|uniref:Phytanoyl-CoA dioxygenase n=1 Tax=Tieghemostelium lacteum TaxID=361077 RepID=A0A151Z370_TIELA|nr:hypothetical protein DLAC_10956 [Tieghemostelium lacteum]|eukprot:KYQ88264.1 hypothetical protein DLAC_10956 [Tieghemostelium lacteum]
MLHSKEEIEDREKCNRYQENWRKWRKDLYENGWVVIPNVVVKERVQYYRDQFWDWLEGLSPKLNRNDPTTWINENWPGNFNGILTGYSFGHNQFVWDIRQEDALISIFKEIYQTSDLLVSFDGGNVSRPLPTKRDPWWHVDQSNDTPYFRCIQGFLNLEDCGEHDGGLVVYTGSHNYFDKYFKESGERCQYDDYYNFEQDPRTIEQFKNCKEVKVCLNAGDVCLWDSRTIHWAVNPSSQEGSGKCRMVVYTSYQPRSWASQMSLSIKQQAFQKKQMTTHWASENISLTDPSFVDDGDTKYALSENYTSKELPKLSETGKKLAGF